MYERSRIPELCVHLGTTLIEYKYIQRQVCDLDMFSINIFFPSALALSLLHLFVCRCYLSIQHSFFPFSARLPSGIGHNFTSAKLFGLQFSGKKGYMGMKHDSTLHSPIIIHVWNLFARTYKGDIVSGVFVLRLMFIAGHVWRWWNYQLRKTNA